MFSEQNTGLDHIKHDFNFTSTTFMLDLSRTKCQTSVDVTALTYYILKDICIMFRICKCPSFPSCPIQMLTSIISFCGLQIWEKIKATSSLGMKSSINDSFYVWFKEFASKRKEKYPFCKLTMIVEIVCLFPRTPAQCHTIQDDVDLFTETLTFLNHMSLCVTWLI